MDPKSNPNEHIQLLLDEHEEILTHINELADWTEQLKEKGFPKFGELGTRVKSFRDLLAKHFKNEEQEGYFKPIFDESPGCCIMVPDFHKKHAESLCNIDNFIARLKESEHPFQSWDEALKQFDALLIDLRAHENQEIKMVQEAFKQSPS
ncbi:hemerythrin domain-containing protein [Gimesia aquarii]|uniref:Hemerythrin-like domain-containing protein n=1 Tax=Gimesia aquarii TaxID=2527964 RepID=A0A517WZP8_9PLAN|nr:hemerythrin domain-containing protein [Gimesia aquarii]QDU10722.1 hypothetical protein V202x_41340 [Gimesia aquarii]